MQLRIYLANERLSYAEFARRIGTQHARTVERYAKQQQRPNAAMMAAIYRATDGEVAPNDFFELTKDRVLIAAKPLTLPPTGSAAAHD